MALSVSFKPKAVSQLKDLEPEVRQEIEEAVEKLAEEGIGDNENVKVIEDGKDWIWRLKVKEEVTDHRVFFDLEDGSEIKVLSIKHRDNAYND